MLQHILSPLQRARAAQRRLQVLWNAPSYYWYNHYKKIDLSRDVGGFSALATRIIEEQRTYLTYDRLYTLYQATRYVPAGSMCVEVGVYRGGSSKFLAPLLRDRGATLYSCDTFSGHAEVDPQLDGDHRVNAGFSNVAVDDVRAYLSRESNIQIVVGNIMETWSSLPDLPIGLVHCDVDVYPATKFVLENAWSRLAVGSMCVVDDYGFTTCVGAKKAVDEFGEAHPDCTALHLLTGQAVLVKTRR
jgi:O-methyltransferase